MNKVKIFVFLFLGGLSFGMFGWYAHPPTPLLLFQAIAFTGLGAARLWHPLS